MMINAAWENELMNRCPRGGAPKHVVVSACEEAYRSESIIDRSRPRPSEASLLIAEAQIKPAKAVGPGVAFPDDIQRAALPGELKRGVC